MKKRQHVREQQQQQQQQASAVEDSLKEPVLAPLNTEQDILLAHYVPVYVMLPLDTVTRDNVLAHTERLVCNLRALRAAGVDGVMVDVWWGVVESAGPRKYDWSAYHALFCHISAAGLKIQAVMSFHQCGGNTGDSCFIPLPHWVLAEGDKCPDIFFTNRDGLRNREYLSFGVDDEPVLAGRTGVQVYTDFMRSFRAHFLHFLHSGIVTEVEVGLGPAGELRYPSYPETHGWRFPGIGEFQCYDKFLLAQLSYAAQEAGQYQWGYSGPHDAGRYNDWPQATGFFGPHGSFATDYGRFFLEWYSSVLLRHGDAILEAATDVFVGLPVKLAAKVAGVHWWYNSHNHAAELAAGYYNLRERDGYRPIALMLARHSAMLNFTCAEMRNHEQYWEARCGPEGLVQQVLDAGWQEGLEVACENALPRYDVAAFDQIIHNARPDGINWSGRPLRRISSFTFLRLGPDLLRERNWAEFVRFVRRMHVGLDRHPEPEQYFNPRKLVRRSRPKQAVPQDPPPAPVASVPLHSSSLPLSPPTAAQPFFSPDAPGGGLGAEMEAQGQGQGQGQGKGQGKGQVEQVGLKGEQQQQQQQKQPQQQSQMQQGQGLWFGLGRGRESGDGEGEGVVSRGQGVRERPAQCREGEPEDCCQDSRTAAGAGAGAEAGAGAGGEGGDGGGRESFMAVGGAEGRDGTVGAAGLPCGGLGREFGAGGGGGAAAGGEGPGMEGRGGDSSPIVAVTEALSLAARCLVTQLIPGPARADEAGEQLQDCSPLQGSSLGGGMAGQQESGEQQQEQREQQAQQEKQDQQQQSGGVDSVDGAGGVD
ncbi:hypothetical protein CLOM_g10699 [Closterium sp. NIES-68]|nr:hypothetical protein CLOM_g10699 [Closterium sp. NIES-68]GJP69922.1 hypothetical protein CLOP_g919 [Closterium sp. NIES-67]